MGRCEDDDACVDDIPIEYYTINISGLISKIDEERVCNLVTYFENPGDNSELGLFNWPHHSRKQLCILRLSVLQACW